MTERTLSNGIASTGEIESCKGCELITVRGLIIAVDWNEKGEVVGLAISSYDEREYLIGMQDKGIELLKFIRKEVELTGTINEKEGKGIVYVKKYTLLCKPP